MTSGNTAKLFLVVTPEFVPGALVTLSSFLKHHPREGREVYILQRGLGPVERASFAKLPFRYHFLEHDPRITDLAAGLPIPTERRDRLLVLQAFQLNDPEPILVLDADLLIQGSLSELLELPGPIVGVGEEIRQAGGWRDGTTLEEGFGPPVPGALTDTINTGIFRLDSQIRGEDAYRSLLQRLEPDWGSGLKTDLTDQAVINHQFHRRMTLAPARFNYVLQERELYQRVSGLTPEQCPVLHFSGPVKPWINQRLITGDRSLLPAARLWVGEWLEVLERLSGASR